MEVRAERMEGQVSEEGKLEQDFKGSCSRKLNPGLRSLAMVRNKGKCEERQDELEMVGKRIQKNGMKVLCIPRKENRLRDGRWVHGQKRRKAGKGSDMC